MNIVAASKNVTVSWRVRTEGEVLLRLYRIRQDGGAALVTQVNADSGLSTFRVVDSDRPSGDTIYHLRVVSRGGVETILGSMLCVEWRVVQAPATAPTGSSRLAACTEDTIGVPDLRSGTITFTCSLDEDEWVRAPDPPVPRSA